jgi:anti-sigma B factor antagonist
MKEGVSGETVVWLTGRKVSLDEEALDRIHDQLLALADEPIESDLLLDFGNVEYVTSTALGTLVSLHKKLLARGRHMTVGNLSPPVYEVFAVTGLDKFLDLRLVGQEHEPAARDGQLGSPTIRSPALSEIGQLETHVQSRLHGRVRHFRLVARGCGLVLTGRAGTYYGKQLAQHAVMEATSLPILANEIEVY